LVLAILLAVLVAGRGASNRRGRLQGLGLLLSLLLMGRGLGPLLGLGLLHLLLTARLLGLRPLLLARLVLDLALLHRLLAGLIGLSALLLIGQQGPGLVVMLTLLRRLLAGLIVVRPLLLRAVVVAALHYKLNMLPPLLVSVAMGLFSHHEAKERLLKSD
jgi:hypothetical protein